MQYNADVFMYVYIVQVQLYVCWENYHYQCSRLVLLHITGTRLTVFSAVRESRPFSCGITTTAH